AATAAAGSTVSTQYGTLTVNGDGTWSYTSGAGDHCGVPLSDGFTYVLADYDGDISTAAQAIALTDEGPTPPEDPTGQPGSTVVPVLVHETDLETGPASDSRALILDFGPDGPADTDPVVLEVPAALEGLGLTSGGTALSYG